MSADTRAALQAWRHDWRTVLSILSDHKPERVAEAMDPAECRRMAESIAHVRDYLSDMEAALSRGDR